MPTGDANFASYEAWRLGVLTLKSINPKAVTDSLAFAAEHRICPTMDIAHWQEKDCDPFTAYYTVTGDFLEKVGEALDDAWLKNTPLTFYGLEDKFGGKGNRMELLYACRYFKLHGMFDDAFFKTLAKAPDCPAEAHGLGHPITVDPFYG